AIERAKSTDGKAIIAALEQTDLVLGRGRYRFSTGHTPDWAYHQFMDAPVALIQYDKVDQTAEDAPIVWPRESAAARYTYLQPGQWGATNKLASPPQGWRRGAGTPEDRRQTACQVSAASAPRRRSSGK